jgi:hypothetical protein
MNGKVAIYGWNARLLRACCTSRSRELIADQIRSPATSRVNLAHGSYVNGRVHRAGIAPAESGEHAIQRYYARLLALITKTLPLPSSEPPMTEFQLQQRRDG